MTQNKNMIELKNNKEKEKHLNEIFKDISEIINKNFQDIPILIGEYGVYKYFDEVIYSEIKKPQNNKIELLVKKSILKEFQKIAPLNGYKRKEENSYEKEGVTLYIEETEKYNLNIENFNLKRSYPSFYMEKEKIIWKESKTPNWKYLIPNYEGFEKIYEKRKEKKKLKYFKNLWIQAKNEKEEESVCFYEENNKNEDQKASEYLEIVSNVASYSSIKKVFPENLSLIMCLSLGIGDISDIYEKRRNWILERNEDFEIEKSFKKLETYLKKVKKVRIWSSHTSPDEYLLFCFLCDYLKEESIYVTFADELDEYTWSIGCMTKEEVNILSKKEQQIKKEEKKKYQNIWLKAFQENSDIRYMKDKKVISASFDSFNENLLEIVSKYEEPSVATLIGSLMGVKWINDFGCFEYEYLIKRLIKKNQLEIKKDGRVLDKVKYFNGSRFMYSIIKVNDSK